MSTTNPRYADICALLDQLVPPTDNNIDDAPHAAFWRTGNPAPNNYIIRDDFVSITTDGWGFSGNLVTPGNASQSNLYLALSGTKPFDGSQAPQMPDTTPSGDPLARHATTDEQTMVQTWINNGAPA
jgi:hypothetical protein